MINFEVRIASVSDAEKIIFDPEIYGRIKVDGIEVKELPTKNIIYVGGYIDDEIVALSVYYMRDKYTTFHLYVLEDFRAKMAVTFMKRSIVFSPTSVLYTNIKKGFPEVERFAKYFNFKFIGCIGEDNLYGVVL